MTLFRNRAEEWLAEQELRKLRPTSLSSYRSIIQTHLNPRFGETELSDLARINNKALRELVADLRHTRKAAATIRLIAQTFKSVMESPLDDNGVRLYRCEWNHEFVNLPAVNPLEQRAPMISTDEVNAIVASKKDAPLYAFLAGTGCRISEALALTGADWDGAAGVIHVRASKTAAGIREIDLPRGLNAWLETKLDAAKRQERLFPAALTTYRERARGVTGAFHSFRRFKLTHLRRCGAPEDLLRFWLGHSDKTISDRYSRLRCDRGFRREWVERCGLGFALPERPGPATVDSGFVKDSSNEP